jgi:hypothetical protein
MTKKRLKTRSLIEHYKELNATGRHYDQQFWVIPSASYSLSILLYGIAFSKSLNDPIIKSILLYLVPLITFGFLIQMINERAFSSINKKRLESVRKQLLLFDKSIYHKNWIKCWKTCVNSLLILTLIMAIILILQIAIAIHYQ